MATDMDTVTVTGMAIRQNKNERRGGLLVLGICLGSLGLHADAGEWTITPTIGVTETATDNVRLSSTQAKSALISDITPGISIDGSGGRASLHLNYQLHSLFHSNDPSANNELQNSLSATGTLEAVESWLFIDASASISQQSISAFGAAPASSGVNTNANGNITETGNYTVSPYIRGAFGSYADYTLRYTLATTNAKSNAVSNTDSETWLGTLKGKTSLASVGWSVDGSAAIIDQGALRSKKDNRLRGVLYYQFDPQFQVSLIGGREENNYETIDMASSTIGGAGFAWTPTERTRLAFSRESRFFGPANTFEFSHRTAQTAWQMSASKDVTSQGTTQQTVNLGTNFNLLNRIYTSAIPDPVARAAYVNALLLASGISPNAELQGGFLTSGTALQQSRQASFALIGARNTVTFAATQSNTQNVTLLNGLGVDYGSGASSNNVDQIGTNVNWSHQLTPQSSLIASAAYLNSKGTGTNTLETTTKLFNVNFVTNLGAKTNAGIGARRVIASGTTGYTENAVTGTLSHRF